MAFKNGKRFKPSSRSGLITKDKNTQQVKSLNCYKKVYSMLLHGEPVSEVARFIQEDAGELIEFKRSTIIDHITKLRDSIPKADFLVNISPKFVDRIANQLEDLPDVSKELSKLLRIQQERVQTVLDKEKEYKTITPYGNQAIDLCSRLLKQIHEVQSDLGITPRNLGGLSINVEREDFIKKLPASMNVTKEGHHRIMGIFDKFKLLENLTKNRSGEIIDASENYSEEIEEN